MTFLAVLIHCIFFVLANNSLPSCCATWEGMVSFLGRLLAWSTGGLSFPLAILLWMGALPLSLLLTLFQVPLYH